MRGYKKKLERYRLPPERYKYLRELCLNPSLHDTDCIRAALTLTVDDELAEYIYRHVTNSRYTWSRMESDGLPCSRDTFRFYRAKFYYYLDRIERGDFSQSIRAILKEGDRYAKS